MSVKELQALTQQFADAFDQRDLKTFLAMLSDDVEVFDHVPYRFDGKPLFAKYLNEVVEGLASASFGFRQPSCRVYGDTAGIVNAHDMFTGVTKDGKVLSIDGRTTLVFIKQVGAVEDVVNHVLNMKRGRVEVQHESIDFAAYGAALDATPDSELADLKVTSAEADLLVTEEMLSCTSGMLLCLDREQRLTFILGAIFEVSDTVGAEVLEITPDNFRQRLARARRDLRNFMNDKCGLVNQANPCRCAKKTRGFIQAGYVDPENLLFVRERIGEVREAAPKVHEALSTLDEKCAEIFRGHPFYKAPDLAPMLRRLVARTYITN